MTLQSYTLTIGALIDENNSGKNYVSDQPIYIKTKAGVLAPIFRDIDGTSEIFQDGLSNKTDSRGQFVFFVEQGDYIAEYQSQQTPISVFGADYFNSRIDESVAQITADVALSRGYNRKGTFASGFTYELANDVGIDADGNAWVYTDIDALPVTVSAGTVPSEPEYTAVVFNDAEGISLKTNGITKSLQEWVDGRSELVTDFGLQEGSISQADSNQAVINSMRMLGIKRFKFPAGNFYMNYIDLSDVSSFVVEGEGRTETALWLIGANDFGLKVGNHSGTYNSGGRIKGLSLNGTIASGTDYTNYVYNIDKMLHIGGLVNGTVIEDVRLRFANTAYHSTDTPHNWNRIIDGLDCWECGEGFLSAETNASEYSSIMIFKYQGRAIDITGFGTTINSLSCESGAGTDFACQIAARGITVNGLYMEGNLKSLRFRGNPSNRSIGSVVTGLYVKGKGSGEAGGVGVDYETSNGCVVLGGFVRNVDTVYTAGDSTRNSAFNNVVIEDYNVLRSGAGIAGVEYKHQGEYQMSAVSSSQPVIKGWTRNNKSVNLLRQNFTTLNDLIDVYVNDSPEQWRTWLGGRAGADGGVRPAQVGMYLGGPSYKWGKIYSEEDRTDKLVATEINCTGVVRLSGLPTSGAGLAVGELWNDSGTIKIKQ